MKTLKNPSVLAEELHRFGNEEYMIYSPFRKVGFVSAEVNPVVSAYSIDKLEIGKQLSSASNEAIPAIEAFINES